MIYALGYEHQKLGVWIKHFPKSFQTLKSQSNYRRQEGLGESENFSNSSLHGIFQSENFRISLYYEKKTNLESEMQKVNLQKIVGNLLVKLRKLYIRMEHSPGNF